MEVKTREGKGIGKGREGQTRSGLWWKIREGITTGGNERPEKGMK